MVFRYFLFVLFVCFTNGNAWSQLTKEQRIQDSIIGWWNNDRFDKLKPQTDPVSKRKEQNLNKFVEWMKKTYTPVAGLGTVSRYISKEVYGVRFLVWNVSHDKMWTDEKGNFKPIPEENTPFLMYANLLPGSYPIEFINKSGGRMFTMQPNGWQDTKDGVGSHKGADPRIDPNAYKYITWTNEWTNIFLAPNNKLPIVPITRRQLLQAAEDALAWVTEQERKNVAAQWPNSEQTQNEAMVMRKKNIEKQRANMHALGDKYRNSLDEPAIVRDMQVTTSSFTTDPDLFDTKQMSGELKHAYPVYTIDSAVVNKLGDDTPQWITISVPFETKENGNQKFEMYTAVTHNLNFDYIYNYFFDPEKVQGIAYTPANLDDLAARMNAYKTKNKKDIITVPKASAKDGNVIFADDLSQNSIGADPQNWFYRKQSRHSVISNAPGQQGKWIALGFNNPVMPLLKYPLPQNCSIDFDLVTDGGFESRTGGSVRLSLNTRKTTEEGMVNSTGKGELLTLNFVSGNEANYTSNYRGEIDIDLNSSPSKNIQNQSEGLEANVPLREFTNNKTKIHVSVKLKNGNISIAINGKEVSNSSQYKLKYGTPCISCGFDPASVINSIYWTATTDDSDNIKVYLGNVEIVRL